MKCPMCQTHKLKTGKVKDAKIRVDYCTQCKGIWLDKNEILPLLEGDTPELKIPSGADMTPRCCPKCHSQFHAFKYPNTLVRIDMCPQCQGIWLDHNELKEIQRIQKTLAPLAFTRPQDDEPTGVKGALIRLINNAIDDLMLLR